MCGQDGNGQVWPSSSHLGLTGRAPARPGWEGRDGMGEGPPRDPHRILYLVGVPLSVYGTSLAVPRLFPRWPGSGVAFASAVVLLVILLAWSGALAGNPFRRLRPAFRWRAFGLAMAAALPITLLGAVLASLGQADWVLELARPAFWEEWRPFYPVVALVYWGLQGILVAYFFIGLPCVLWEGAGRWRWVGPFLLVALNYNAPLLSGHWNPIDILWLGVLWPWVYRREGGPGSLALAYLAVEGPVMWALVAPWGAAGVVLYTWARVVLGVVGGLLWWRGPGGPRGRA